MNDDPSSTSAMDVFDETRISETLLTLELDEAQRTLAERIRGEIIGASAAELVDAGLAALSVRQELSQAGAKACVAGLRQDWIDRLSHFGEGFDTPGYYSDRLESAAASAHDGIPLTLLHMLHHIILQHLVERIFAHFMHDSEISSTLLSCLLKLTTLDLHLMIAGHRQQQIEDLRSSLEQLQEKAARLYQKAATDQLTGVMSFSNLMDALHRQVEKAGQTGKPLCVLMADLDFFKCVNDSYGHLAGDIVLTHAAQRIKSAVRDFDLVGRFGGEEFTVILTNSDLELAKIIAERIRQEVSNTPFHAKQHVIEVTISLGVAMLKPGEMADALLERADAALYSAKRSGRNRVVAAEDIE